MYKSVVHSYGMRYFTLEIKNTHFSGAWIFILLEQPYEEETFSLKSIKIKDLEDSEDYFIKFCWHLGGQNITNTMWTRKVRLLPCLPAALFAVPILWISSVM